MKIVMTFWSFDLVHPWHKYYLSEAKKLGEKLITIVAKDSTIKKIKWKSPLYPENKRILDVKQLWISNIVELWHSIDVISWIKKHNPDIIAIGYDQTSFIPQLNDYLQKNNLSIKVISIWAYKENIYKSSKLKNL